MYTLYNISITKIILETVSNKLSLKLKNNINNQAF